MPMDMQSWFESLTCETILAMKGDTESQITDCKRIFDEKDVKRNLAIALSDNANGQGGVIIWGAKAVREAGIDCIRDFPGVSDAIRFASRLDELTSPTASAGVPGVQHRSLIGPPGSNVDFVVSLIPESSSGPHMARFSEDRYYQRIGFSFVRMEPFQIADMFGRRVRPELKIDYLMINAFEFRFEIKTWVEVQQEVCS